MQNICYKIADTAEEILQLQKLNYRTFVEEIPQHEVNSERILVDKFHAENIYLVAKLVDQVIGMLAYRDQRPFSLDDKLGNMDDYLQLSYDKICEIRLLSVDKKYRHTDILFHLIIHMLTYIRQKGCDIAVISGILAQQKLYKHIGFIPFGPVVGNDAAHFQPMYIFASSLQLNKLEKMAKEMSLKDLSEIL